MTRSGRRSTRRSAGSARSTRSSACSCARARSSRCCSSSRTCTGSTPRPRRCSTAWSRACRRPGSCSSSTTGPSTSTAGAARPTTRSSALDPLPPRERRASCSAALLGDGRRPLGPLERLLIERTEATRSSWRRACGRWWRRRRSWASAARTGWRRRSSDIQVPATVQAILAARIDRLPPEDKRLLQSAAVIGKDVPFALLRRASPTQPEDELRRGLARLQAAEFLYETSLFPDLEYTFKHALTHEVAYGSLLQERRRALHARIVEAIERLYADRLGEHVERLAHHALRGEVWDKAVDVRRQARRPSAVDRSATGEVAETFFEQALEALRRTARDPRDARAEHRVYQLIAGPLFALGNSEAYLACMRRGAGRRRAARRPERLADVESIADQRAVVCRRPRGCPGLGPSGRRLRGGCGTPHHPDPRVPEPRPGLRDRRRLPPGRHLVHEGRAATRGMTCAASGWDETAIPS